MRTCEDCGSHLVPVVMGMPGPDMVEAAQRGEVILGGCLIGPDGWDLVGCPNCPDRRHEPRRRTWVMVANPKRSENKWDWSDTWEGMLYDGSTNYWYGKLAANYEAIERDDYVLCYESSPTRAIVGRAVVADVIEDFMYGRESPLVLSRPVIFDKPLPLAAMKASAELSQSEPLRLNLQGTLFALTHSEARAAGDLLRMYGIDYRMDGPSPAMRDAELEGAQ